MARDYIYRLIDLERERQDKIHGIEKNIVNRSRMEGYVVLMEEIGEVAYAIIERAPQKYREELIQCAAVIVAMIEANEKFEAQAAGLREKADEVGTAPIEE